MDKLVERWQISSTLLRGWIPEDFTKALFADAVDIDSSNMYWTDKRKRKYTLKKEWIGMLMCTLSGFYESLTSQNALASFKEKRILAMLGRALRSSRQHRSTVLHSSSLNPRRFAPSGFFGRIPPKIEWMTLPSDRIPM